MDDGGRLWQGLLITLAAVLIMGFFSACESCIVEANDARIKKLAEQSKRAKRLLKIIEKPNSLRITSIVFRTTMIVVMSAVGTNFFYRYLTEFFLNLTGIADNGSTPYLVVGVVSFILLILVMTVFISVLGINLPKRIATSGKLSEKFAIAVSGIFSAFMVVFKPLELAATGLTWLLLRIFGVKTSKKSDTVTEEEILMMVDAVNETGGIEESQAEMINNIFEFDDLEIKDVMTHRIDVTAVEMNSPVNEAVHIAIDEGFSRIPVYDGTIDNVCGVIFAKDMLNLIFEKSSENHRVCDYMREIKYIPETNRCGELFEMFTSQKAQIAVAVDEYGGTAGIVTMEDLLESIVGNIQDEYDDEVEEIQEITPSTFDIIGSVKPEDVLECLGIEEKISDEFDTIGGFVIALLGYIPDDDKTPSVMWHNIEFTVIKATDNRIEKLRAVIKRDKQSDTNGGNNS